MSLRIRTTVSGQTFFLDTFQDEPVLVNLSFAELQDITKKNSAYSRSFSLPGSKINNQVFNYFYELNSVPIDFNPNNKYDTTLMWDGYEILTGSLRLNAVNISDGDIVYNVTFYNQIGDLMSNIGDKFLYDLNLSGLSHPYSQQVIPQSNLDPTLFPMTGSTNYSYQNGKILWGLFNIGYEYDSNNALISSNTPLIKFSPVSYGPSSVAYVPSSPNFDFSGTPVRDWYFKPAIQVKELYTQIVEQAGYNINSEFFNTDYFSKFYMPLKFTSESIYSQNAVPACFTYSGLTPFVGGLGNTSGFTNPSTGQSCNSLAFTSNSSGFTISSAYTGQYEFKISFEVQPAATCDVIGVFRPQVIVSFYDGTSYTILYNQSYCDVNNYPISFSQFYNVTGTSQISFYYSVKDAFLKNFKFEIVNPPRFLIEGSTIDYQIEFPTNDYKQIDFITSVNKYFNFVVVPEPDKPQNLIIEPIVDYIGSGDIKDWTTKVDYSRPQSIFPSNILVNGTLDFEFKEDQDFANNDFKKASNRIFGTDKFLLGQDYKDQTTKFDYIFGSPIDITISNAYVPYITVGSLSKINQQDRDGIVTQQFQSFKILPRLIFRGPTVPNDSYGFIGGSGITSGNAFCTSGITLNVTDPGYIRYTNCGNIVNYQYVGNGSYTIPVCADASTVLPGFPYADTAVFTITTSGATCNGLVLPEQYQYWYMNSIQNDRFTNLNRFTTYPFNYNDFSHYCNFRGEDVPNIKPGEYVFDSEDLYDIYYQDYVNDVISENNKLYSCNAYLQPDDIKNLRWDEKIRIGNQYFRINRIQNFNLLEPSICELELIKLTQDYRQHRVLYYDLTPCAGGPVLHSNSDLNYHLYVYANNYAKVFDDSLNYLGCYGITVGTYNPSYNYQHYFLSSAYTPNLIGIYDNCSCTGRTDSDIIQEVPGNPRRFYYSGNSCDTNIGYAFSSTTSPLPSTFVKITNGNTEVCLSGVNISYAQVVTYSYLSSYNNCTECNLPPTPPPTATPSRTPNITPTTTLTPTVSPCVECYQYTYYANSSGLLVWEDCDGILTDTFVTAGSYYYINCPGARKNTVSGNGIITQGSLCSSQCLTPSVTPTFTSTPTITPTMTNTIGLTPSVTPTLTKSPTPTPTIQPSCTYDIVVDNNANSIDITDVEVNTTPVTYSSGDNFPIIPSGNGTFTSTITGLSVTFTVYYDASAGNKSVNIIDCDSNVYCQNITSSGVGSLTFEGISTDCNCQVTITITDGACL